jgi:hypothetical protein
MAYKVRNEVVKTSQITGGVGNAVPLHVHIPRIDGRGSDLPFEAVLGGYSCKPCPSNNPTKKKITRSKIG